MEGLFALESFDPLGEGATSPGGGEASFLGSGTNKSWRSVRYGRRLERICPSVLQVE